MEVHQNRMGQLSARNGRRKIVKTKFSISLLNVFERKAWIHMLLMDFFLSFFLLKNELLMWESIKYKIKGWEDCSKLIVKDACRLTSFSNIYGTCASYDISNLSIFKTWSLIMWWRKNYRCNTWRLKVDWCLFSKTMLRRFCLTVKWWRKIALSH